MPPNEDGLTQFLQAEINLMARHLGKHKKSASGFTRLVAAITTSPP